MTGLEEISRYLNLACLEMPAPHSDPDLVEIFTSGTSSAESCGGGGTRCGKVQIKSSRLDSAYFVRSLRQSQPAAAPHEQSLASPAESRCALHAEATRVAESESEYMMAALAGTYIETEYEKEIPAEAGASMLSWISVTSFWT
jgi:hypothetical protein